MASSPHDRSCNLTAEEVGALLRRSPNTINRWARSGEIPSVRLPGGAGRIFPQDMLEAWMEENTCRGPEKTPTSNNAQGERAGTSSRPTAKESALILVTAARRRR